MPKRRPSKRRSSKPARVPPRVPTRKKPKCPHCGHAKHPKQKCKAKRCKCDLRSSKSKRSAASKKGWDKRKKRKRMLEALADLRLKNSTDPQPLGWFERRMQLRLHNNKLWRQVIVEFDSEIVKKKRLDVLKELQIDLLGREDLDSYLRWLAEETGHELSEMYAMYLGYQVGAVGED